MALPMPFYPMAGPPPVEEEMDDETFAELQARWKARGPLPEGPEHECPLFMDEIPSDPAVAEANPALAALQDIMYTQTTTKEAAESLRDRGNAAMKTGGPMNWRTAVGVYTEALKQLLPSAREDRKEPGACSPRDGSGQPDSGQEEGGDEEDRGVRELRAALLSNRAQAHHLLGNFGHCVRDSL
eukprot:RCo030637